MQAGNLQCSGPSFEIHKWVSIPFQVITFLGSCALYRFSQIMVVANYKFRSSFKNCPLHLKGERFLSLPSILMLFKNISDAYWVHVVPFHWLNKIFILNFFISFFYLQELGYLLQLILIRLISCGTSQSLNFVFIFAAKRANLIES